MHRSYGGGREKGDGFGVNVNQRLEQALSDLVKGDIWPLSRPPDEKGDEYIVYNPELETPEEFGDDEDLEWTQYMQVHWFKKGTGRTRAVNCTEARKKIRKRLRENGFSVSEIRTFFEKDTGFTHLCVSCNTLEEAENDNDTGT